MMDEADVFSITTITTCAKAGTAVELAALVEVLSWTDVGSSPVPRCPQSPIVTSKAAATPAVERDMATRARRPEFTVAFFHHGHGCIKDVAVSFSMFGDVKPETRRNRSPQPRLRDRVCDVVNFFIRVCGALVTDVDLDRVRARGRRRHPGEGVAGAVGLDHGPGAAGGLDPELVARRARAGGAGGERDGAAMRSRVRGAGGKADRAAAVELVGEVVDLLVAVGAALVADVDLEPIAAQGLAGERPAEGVGGAVGLDHGPGAARDFE